MKTHCLFAAYQAFIIYKKEVLMSDLKVLREAKKENQFFTMTAKLTPTAMKKKRETAERSNSCKWKQSRAIHHSPAQSPPPPQCCFHSLPGSEVCWFVGFGSDCLKARLGSTQPQEVWITPSIGVSCQMVSCTCCLKQGGPTIARQILGHVITASEIMMLFTHAHVHNRWVFHTCSSLSAAPLWRRFIWWWGQSCSQPEFSQSSQEVWFQKLPILAFQTPPSHITLIQFNGSSEIWFNPQGSVYSI